MNKMKITHIENEDGFGQLVENPNPSPTTMKECDCRCHGTPYARYYVTCYHCQPSEEKEHKKGYYMSGEGYYNEKGQHISEAEYYSFITANGTSEEKECWICAKVAGRPYRVGEDYCNYHTPNSTALEWEKEFDRLFWVRPGISTEEHSEVWISQAPEPDVIKAFISQLLAEEREDIERKIKESDMQELPPNIGLYENQDYAYKAGYNHRGLEIIVHILDKLSRRV